MPLKVLFPLDGSDRSTRAMDQALEMLAPHPDLEVTLFNVVQEGFEDADEGVVEMFDADEDDEIFPTAESAKRMLDEHLAICDEHGVDVVHQRVAVGTHYDAILEEAADHDLVVMHALDEGQLKEKIRFSQTEKLARNVDASVLLVEDRQR